MQPDLVARFEAMIVAGKDSALLRFSLGDAYLRALNADRAATHLRVAVALEPNYSAAWKLLGKAEAATGDLTAARDAFANGIAVASKMGDKQAAKEMAVFLKRLDIGSGVDTET